MAELLYKELTFAVIGAAMEVHRILGPGFLEVVYQVALEREMSLRGIPFEKQVRLPVKYKDVLVGEYFADFMIDGRGCLRDPWENIFPVSRRSLPRTCPELAR